MLAGLVKDGQMPKGAGYADMEGAFSRGEVAMMITGPWAWDNAKRKVDIDFGVAPIPSIDGQPAKPFVGVLGCMITAPSKVKDIAARVHREPPAAAREPEDDQRRRAARHAGQQGLLPGADGDPNIHATMDNARARRADSQHSRDRPLLPAMDAALEAITNGRQAPKDALDGAAARMHGRVT